MKGLLKTLVEGHFPREHVKCAIGYGSAVFKQANYEQNNRDQVIDILLVVDDTMAFHDKNMTQNYSHYSYFAKRSPLGLTNDLVQNKGSQIYFNPLIPLNSFGGVTDEADQRRIKYGTIGLDNAVNDLSQWSTFGLAGRLQKPVLPFISDSDEMRKAMEQNVTQALNLAVFMHYHEQQVSLEELFTTIVAFSMKGDIRMQYKMENPHKVQNLVEGSFKQLSELYLPLILEMQAEERHPALRFLDDGKIKLRHSPEAQQRLFDDIPTNLKRGLKKSVKQLSLTDLQGDIAGNLAALVNQTSKQMFMSGLYSTNPLKGLPYLLAKRRKAKAAQK